MAYIDVSLLANDSDFRSRAASCYATETRGMSAEQPYQWAVDHSWQLAATPGFGDAYASAIAGGVQSPGKDPSVISDNQILSAVQTLMAQLG